MVIVFSNTDSRKHFFQLQKINLFWLKIKYIFPIRLKIERAFIDDIGANQRLEQVGCLLSGVVDGGGFSKFREGKLFERMYGKIVLLVHFHKYIMCSKHPEYFIHFKGDPNLCETMAKILLTSFCCFMNQNYIILQQNYIEEQWKENKRIQIVLQVYFILLRIHQLQVQERPSYPIPPQTY